MRESEFRPHLTKRPLRCATTLHGLGRVRPPRYPPAKVEALQKECIGTRSLASECLSVRTEGQGSLMEGLYLEGVD